MASEEELERNYEMATAKIMEVFKDPVFTGEDTQMDLEEIDFWKILRLGVISDNIYTNMFFICSSFSQKHSTVDNPVADRQPKKLGLNSPIL